MLSSRPTPHGIDSDRRHGQLRIRISNQLHLDYRDCLVRGWEVHIRRMRCKGSGGAWVIPHVKQPCRRPSAFWTAANFRSSSVDEIRPA